MNLRIILVALCLLPALPVRAQSTNDFETALKLYQDGKWLEALAAFQKFEAANRFSSAVPDAIYYEGWCWLNLNRYAEAANVFERLLRSFPTSAVAPQAMLKQAECWRELKQFDKAAQSYRDFQTKYPKSDLLPQAIRGEAATRYKAKDYAGAKAALRTMRERFPDDLDALFLLGQVLTDEKSYAEAQQIYRQISAQRSNPRATEGLYLGGEAMYEAKRYADAIAYYRGVRSTAELLDNVQRQIDACVAERGDYIRRDALAAWQSRMATLQQLQTQIKARPDLRASALFRIANCYQQLGKPEEASVVYRYLLDQYPNDKVAEQANFGMIQVLAQRGQSEKAGIETETFKKRFPKSLLLENATVIQAEALFGQKNYKDALTLYGKSLAASKDPQVAETIEFRIASCYFNLDQFDKARDAFAVVARKYPQSKLAPEALARLGQTYYEIANRSNDPKIAQPNLVEGVKAYEELRTKYPNADNLPGAIFRLGYLQSYLAANDKAIALFQEFEQKWPNHPLVPEAQYQIARNQLAAKRYDDAVAAYRVMVEKSPDHPLAPFASFEIASAYADAKKLPEMSDALREYVKRYPNHTKVGDALYAIGTQLEAQKKTDDAIVAYRDLINRAAGASPLTDELRNAAIGAQLRICAMRDDQAVAECEGFLAKFANDPVAARAIVSQIANLYRKRKLPAEGYAKLEQITQQYQANASIRIAAATSTIDLALSSNDLDRASAAAAKLLADPEHDKLPTASYLALGNTFLKAEKFSQAREAFEKAMPTPVAQLGLGVAWLGLKQYDKAQAELEKIAAGSLDARLALGKVYEAQGRVKDALAMYDPVWRQGRGDIAFEAAFRVATMAYQAKDYKAALPMFARLFFATGPMAEEAAYRAGECHQALGNLPQACTAFQAYVKRFPSGMFADDARSKVQRLCVPKQG